MAVAAGAPGPRQAVAVGVEVQAPGRSQYLAAPEQDLQRIRCGNAGAELAGHGRRGPLVAVEVDPPPVGQVAQLQHRR